MIYLKVSLLATSLIELVDEDEIMISEQSCAEYTMNESTNKATLPTFLNTFKNREIIFMVV